MRLAERKGFNAAVTLLAAALLIHAYALAPYAKEGLGAMLGAASVGISAGVASNPYNTLAAQLKDKEMELSQREADLALRESDLAIASNRNGLVSLGASALLFLLVGINFYLDRRRSREVRGSDLVSGKLSVDLR